MALTKKMCAALLAATSPFVFAPAVNAQDAISPQVVEVITVTAQQREQNAQSVPISIGAYGAEQIEVSGIRDIKDLTAIAPGLMVTSTQSETITTARIRGIGTVGDNFGLESSVGVYIDGVFRARNGVGLSDLGEIERIEVLRGPQGTLFGKNTSAGVLNIVTKGPEFDFGANAELTAGNYDMRRASGSVTGPIVEDKLAFRLFGVHGQRDGFMKLTVREPGGTRTTRSDDQDYYSVRGQLLWTPTETVSGRIIADYTDRNEFCCSAAQYVTAPAPAALIGAVGGQVLNPADPGKRQAFANREFAQNVTDYGISADFDFDFDFAKLTSVTSWRRWENDRTQDVDYTSADIAYRADGNSTRLRRFDQEFRLTGVHGKLDWLIGAIYSQEDLDLKDAIRFGSNWETYLGLAASGGASPFLISNTLNALAGVPLFALGSALPGGSGVNQDSYDQRGRSWAIFTHNTYQLTDRFALTGGLRWTRETKKVNASFSTNPTPGCGFLEGVFGPDPIAATVGTPLAGLVPRICLPYARSSLDANGYDQSRTDEKLSGTIRATYNATEDAMIYAGYSRGFKAGGYNLDRQFNGATVGGSYVNSDSSFGPETVDSFEIGFKSQLFSNSLQLNGNVFYQLVDDFQLNTFTGLAFVVENIKEVETRGVELDFIWAPPVDGLTISGGYALVDARYGNNLGPLPAALARLPGKRMSLTPRHSATLQFIYQQPVGNGLVFLLGGDGRWVSDYNTGSDLAPGKVQPSFALFNGRVGIGAENGLWALELWARNLTNKTYAQVAFDQFAQTGTYGGFLGAPRTVGLTLRSNF
jgi:iron complex outermembrane receptor protein